MPWDEAPNDAPPPKPLPAAAPRKRGLPAQDGADLVSARDGFHTRFVAYHGGAKPGWDGKAITILRGILRKAGAGGATEVLRRADVMFGLGGRFPAEHPDLQTLAAHWDKFTGAPPRAGRAAGYAPPMANGPAKGDQEI